MKHVKISLIFLLLISLMSLSFLSEPLSAETFDQKNIDQSEAISVYRNLMNSLYRNGTTKCDRPSFGGAFLEGERLIILDKEYEPGSDDLYEMQSSPCVEVRKCKYGYNELYDLFEKISASMLNNRETSIIECCIADDLNLVSVTVLGDANDDSLICSLNIDTSMLRIRHVQTENQFASKNLYPGGKIWMNPLPMSMGYRATKNGKIGFVTAAHGAPIGTQILDYDGTIIGNCAYANLGGSVDASFIEITGDFTPSSQMAVYNNTGGNLSPVLDSPPVGTIINKVGMATFHTNGTITSANATVTMSYNNGANSITLTNMTQTNVNVYYGDSGGVFYTYYPNSSPAYKICGITSSFNAATGNSYYCKASLINSSLGLVIY